MQNEGQIWPSFCISSTGVEGPQAKEHIPVKDCFLFVFPPSCLPAFPPSHLPAFPPFSRPLARTRSRSLHRQGGGPGECQGPKAPCSFCPTEVTPAEGTGQVEAGARGARSAVHQRVRALVLLVLFVLVCHCPCPLDKDNDRQGQEEQEAQEPAPFGAPRFERRERRPPRVLSPRPESPQRGKKNKGPRHCCPEKLRRPRYPVSAARREQLLTTRSRRAFVRNTPVGDTAPWHKGRTGGVVLGVALLGVVVDRAVLLLPLRRMASRISAGVRALAPSPVARRTVISI